MVLSNRRLFLEGHEVYVHASIGISVFPHDGEDLRTLLMNAGTALNETRCGRALTIGFTLQA